MHEINLLQASFNEIDAVTEKTPVTFTDNYKSYTVEQLEKFVRNLGFLLDWLDDDNNDACSNCSNLSSYLYNVYWDLTHEMAVESQLFKLTEKHFYSLIELAATVLKEGAAYA